MRVTPHTKVRADRVAQLETLPVDVAWQARTAELPDVVHDHSREGADAGLAVVRELPS